jgi:transcriptional regulator with XRE-family HTH domain
MDPYDPVTHKAIAKAVGEELRRRREALGLSRDKLVGLLPFEFGARSLLSYEHGTRKMSVVRLVELCHPLHASPPDVLGASLQRAGICLQNLTLQVDLHELLQYRNLGFEQLLVWADNKLAEASEGIVPVTSSARQEMAALMSCDENGLTRHLAQFVPSRPVAA